LLSAKLQSVSLSKPQRHHTVNVSTNFMNSTIRHLSIFIFSIGLIGCDCFVYQAGFVIDAETHQPIPDATVEYDIYSVKTDSLGYFEIEEVTGFCPDWNIHVTKEGYKPFEMSKEIDNDHINFKLLDKSEFVEFEKPKYLNQDSTSYILGEHVNFNSTGFNYINPDSLIILLKK